jgi:pre-mRNA-processing factor 19
MVELGFEDPAGGSAACTLASYLAVSSSSGSAEERRHFAITQGVEMGRRSEIAVDVVTAREGEAGEVKIREMYLGGTVAVVMSGTISV